MSPARKNGHPPSGTASSVPAETCRRGRSFQSADGVQDVRNRAGTIVSIVVECFMTASISVRFSDELISCGDGFAHSCRRGWRRIGHRSFHESGPRRIVVIRVWRSCFTSGQNECQAEDNKQKLLGQHGLDCATGEETPSTPSTPSTPGTAGNGLGGRTIGERCKLKSDR